MITAKHVKVEMKKAKEVFANPNATTEQKLEAIFKLQTVALKLGVSNRLNVVRIMEKLEIPKVEPTRRPEEGSETTGTETEEK